ncbi:TPA: class A beta-lactamase [Photobacterium damselae]
MIAVLGCSLLLSTSASAEPFTSQQQKALVDIIKQQEKALNGTIGMAVLDTDSGSVWNYNGDMRFPMMSTFKSLACAKLLADSDSDSDSDKDKDKDKSVLTYPVVIKKSELVTYSPVTEKWVGKRFTPKQACDATMTFSDNTAANIVLHAVGGPEQLTEFLRSRVGDRTTRLDRTEPTLNEAKLNDPRDTTTPIAIAETLNKLMLSEHILTKPSQQQLITWMEGNQVAAPLLRSVLPKGWKIADRSGAGGFGSRGITAVVWPTEHEPMVVSIYIQQSSASMDERNKAIATIGKQVFTYF